MVELASGSASSETWVAPAPSASRQSLEVRALAKPQLREQARGLLGMERDDVHDVGAGLGKRRDQLGLDVGGPQDGRRRVDACVVRVPDAWEPGIGDDGTPPCGSHAPEDLVEPSPELV